MRKFLTSLLFLTIFLNVCHAQNGYVTLENDSTIYGFVRYNVDFMIGEQQIKVWKTKRDKEPEVFKFKEVKEYAYKKDTFRILKSFYPFKSDREIKQLWVNVEQRGKYMVYSSEDLEYDPLNNMPIIQITSGTPMNMNNIPYRPTTYLIEDKDENILIVFEKNFPENLLGFISDKDFEKLFSKKTRYKEIPEIFRIYNKQFATQ